MLAAITFEPRRNASKIGTSPSTFPPERISAGSSPIPVSLTCTLTVLTWLGDVFFVAAIRTRPGPGVYLSALSSRFPMQS